MTISIIASTGNDNSFTNSLTVTHGFTILEDDVILAIANVNDGTAITGFDGFTSDFTSTYSAGSARAYVMSKVAGASEPSSYTFSLTGATQDRLAVVLIQLRGVNTSNIFDVTPALLYDGVAPANSSPADNVDSITTTNNGSLAVAVFYNDSATVATYSALTNGYVEEITQTGQQHITAITKTITTAGATGDVDYSCSAANNIAITHFAINEAVAGASINVDIPLHINLKWDTTHQLAVTHDGGTTTLDGVTLSTPTGWETVTYSGSLPAGDSFASLAATDATLGGGGYTMQAGDILAWETQTNLTVDVNTTPVVDPAATVSGSYKIWNEVGQTWTSVSTFTINDLGLNVGSTIPVDDRVTFQAMVGYLITQGYQGAGNETIQKWLIAEGISKKSFNEMLRDYLTGLGYNGTLPEQLRDWRNG